MADDDHQAALDRSRIDGPFAAVWGSVDGALARGAPGWSIASSALSAVWDAAETVSGADLIRRERMRQLTGEGYTAEHDAQHTAREFPTAAAVLSKALDSSCWPWPDTSPKLRPSDPVHDLVRAGALIAAEIDRRLAADATTTPATVLDEPIPPVYADDQHMQTVEGHRALVVPVTGPVRDVVLPLDQDAARDAIAEHVDAGGVHHLSWSTGLVVTTSDDRVVLAIWQYGRGDHLAVNPRVNELLDVHIRAVFGAPRGTVVITRDGGPLPCASLPAVIVGALLAREGWST